MTDSGTARLIEDFLGSTHVFTRALNNIVEEELLQEPVENQLTPSQVTTLKLVAKANSQTVSDVAAFLGVSAAAASKTVDRLVRRKLVARREGEADRRASELELTELGRKLLNRYESTKVSLLAKTFRQFSTEELRSASRLLDRLSAGIISHSQKPEEVCLQCYAYGREKCLVREAVRGTCDYQRRRRRTQATR